MRFQHFERDKALVVIHRDHAVVLAGDVLDKSGLGANGTVYVYSQRPASFRGGFDFGYFFGAQQAVFARVGVQTG